MSGTTRRGWRFALVLAAAMARALPAQQDVPPDKARLAEAVRADLSRLSGLERAYFAANKRYTVDVNALHFVPASGASIAVSYASARTFSASASHVRLTPFICFVIVAAAEADSPANKPFCTDSRYGSAAASLAREGATPEPTPAAAPRPAARPQVSPGVTQRNVPDTDQRPPKAPTPPAVRPALTPAEFVERLKAAAIARGDSDVVLVQFAIRDARYDPSRGVLEVAVERIALPLAETQTGGAANPRPALACFTRPAFVCGASGLTYIARDLLRVPRSRAPSTETLRSGLTLEARFAIGRRDDTPGPSLTLLALVLQTKGETVSSWEAPPVR